MIRTPYSIRFRNKLIWIMIGMAIGLGIFFLIDGDLTTKAVVIPPKEKASGPTSTSRPAASGNSPKGAGSIPATKHLLELE